MTEPTRPLVSLGLPVYNGEDFLAAALESVSAQTLSDYQLIICDNASTDATEEICRRYAASDNRIQYIRNPVNVGAGPNFNLTFKYATGRYFKWVSHDDTMMPDYLEKMVAVLGASPDTALCHSLVRLIDAAGQTLDIHDSGLEGVDSESASVRFKTMILTPLQCLELDGVSRTDVLAKTSLVPSFAGGDRALLCEIALLGPILQVKEPLFMTREHPGRFRRAANSPEERLAFYDTSRAGQKSVPTLELYGAYWSMVGLHLTESGQRFKCRAHMLWWWFVNWNAARIIVDILALFAPGLLSRAEAIKQKVFTPEPGPDTGGSKHSSEN